MRCEGFHAERLRRIVAAVKNIQPQFLRQSKCPVRTFAGDECVHAFIHRQFQIAARATRHDPDALTDFAARCV